MPEPTLSDVHVDAALTDFSVAYFQDPANFAARAFSPTVPVGKQTDRYFITDKSETTRTDAQSRAPGTEAPTRDFKLSTDQYFCDVQSIGYNVSEQIRSNQDPGVDIEEQAARVLADDIKMRIEVDFAAAAFVTSVWDTNVTGTTDFVKWSNAASTPIEDIATGVETIEAATGRTPNKLLIGAAVWRHLKNHPDVLARISNDTTRIGTTALFAQLAGVDQVIISKAIRNTAEEGLTASLSRILGSNVLLAFVDPNAGLQSTTAMKTFVWSGLIGSSDGVRTKRMDMPWVDALPRIETDASYDFKITGTDLGYMFLTAV